MIFVKKKIYQLEDFLNDLKNTTDIYEINKIAEKLVSSFLNAEFSSIWYYDKTNMKLVRMREGKYLNEIFIEEKKGILYKCFMSQESSLYNYLASDKDYVASIDNPDDIKIKSKIMVPLVDKGEFIGIVTAYNSIKKYEKFNHQSVKKLESLSPYIINAIYKMHLPENFQLLQKNEFQEKEEKKSPKTSDETLKFVANFVHDIRTPANALYGFLDILEDQIQDEKLKSYIINAKESASFINELTTSILNTVSTQQESNESDIKQIDTIQFFSSIAETFSSNMYKKRICFNIFIDPFLPKSIKIDALKLKRVLLNLLGNAYKFTPNNKKVEFSVRYVSKTDKIVIYVKDTGIGIPKEKQKEIFKAFKQADEKTAVEFGGTGLGLFISSKYVKDMGGSLSVVSEVDVGSTFSFDLPVNAIDKQKSFLLTKSDIKIAVVLDPKKDSVCATNIARYMMRLGVEKEHIFTCESLEELETSISHVVVFDSKVGIEDLKSCTRKGRKFLFVEAKVFSMQKKFYDESITLMSKYSFALYEIYRFLNSAKPPKVLIADDDLISIKLIETILESEFCEVVTVQNGQDALDKIIQGYEKGDPFDYMYIDNKMPIINGSDVMRHIRKYEMEKSIAPGLYAISTSGEELDDFTNQFYDIYVGKPFKKDDIRAVLQRR